MPQETLVPIEALQAAWQKCQLESDKSRIHDIIQACSGDGRPVTLLTGDEKILLRRNGITIES